MREAIFNNANDNLKPKSFREKINSFKEKGKEIWENINEALSKKEVRKEIAKTGVGTVASIAGVKSIYDVPAYFNQRFAVHGMFGKGKGVEGSVEEILSSSYEMREGFGREKSDDEQISVRDAFKDLNERLGKTKEGVQKHSEQRKMLAKLIRENRIREKNNKEEREEKITEILDDYTTTKVTGVQATKETLNSFLVGSGAMALRGISYGIMDTIDRNLKLQKEAKKNGEKISFLKDVVIGAVKETWQEARGKDVGGKEKTKLHKTLDGVKAWGLIVRYAGITSTTTFNSGNMEESINKVIDSLEGKNSLGDVGNNFAGNVARIISVLPGPKEANATELPVEGGAEGEAKDGLTTLEGLREKSKEVKDFDTGVKDSSNAMVDVFSDDSSKAEPEELEETIKLAEAETEKSLKDSFDSMLELGKTKLTPEKLNEFYNEWMDEGYDKRKINQFLMDNHGYNAQELADWTNNYFERGGDIKSIDEAKEQGFDYEQASSYLEDNGYKVEGSLNQTSIALGVLETTEQAKEIDMDVFRGNIKPSSSIWTTVEKYLGSKYGDDFLRLGGDNSETGEALQTYNIDRLKDKIAEVISGNNEDLKKEYGLEGIKDADKITLAQLRKINFQEIDKDVFGVGEKVGLTDNLTPEQVKSINKNNDLLEKFFVDHPDAPRSSENYDAIIAGKGDTGEIAKVVETATEAEQNFDKIISDFSGLDSDEDRQKFLENLFQEKTREEQRDLLGKLDEKMQTLKESIKNLPTPEQTREQLNLMELRSKVLDNYRGLWSEVQGEIAELKERISIVAEKALDKNIEKIYEHGWWIFKGSQIEEWEEMQKKKANEILQGNFGKYLGYQGDGAEDNNREQLQEYLSKAKSKMSEDLGRGGSPKKSETVKDYLTRYEQSLVKDIVDENGNTVEDLQNEMREMSSGKRGEVDSMERGDGSTVYRDPGR